MDGEFLLVQIVIGCVMGGIAAAIASSKGRSAVGWFFGGFFLGLIGVIIVAVLPNLREQERVRAHAMAERRRLREQLRQEKMKTEAFRRHATGRLDVHDRALDMDTRRPEALGVGHPAPSRLGQGPAPAPPPPPPPLPAQPPAAEPQWYYEANGDSRGPVPQSTVLWMMENGALKAHTLVWTEGQADWKPASEVPVFRDVARP